MKTEKNLAKIMDLSFLSEEEQFALQEVLQRDTALRKLEENRIRKLKRASFDASTLKVLTGEWFAEVKTKRFGEISSGIDILKNSFNKKKKMPVFQEVAVKASKDANVFLSPSSQYQDIPSEPGAFKADKRLFEEAEYTPQTNAMMFQSQLQAPVNMHKLEDEARTLEGDDLKSHMKRNNEDPESDSVIQTHPNEVLLSNVHSSDSAAVSETNPYSDFTIRQPSHSAKLEEFWTPREDTALQSARESTKNLEAETDRIGQSGFSSVETEASGSPDVSGQIGYFEHSPKAALDAHYSGMPGSDVEITQEPTPNNGTPAPSAEISSNSKENNMRNADTKRKNPFLRYSSTLLSEIIQGATKSLKDDTETAVKSNEAAVKNERVGSESPDMDSSVSSRPSVLKSFAASTQLNESKEKGQPRHTNLDQSSESNLMNNAPSQIKKPGEYNNDTPNLTLGRGETEHSKRKGILKRSPSTSSTESENLSKWTPIRPTEEVGVMSLQGEDSDGSTKMEPGSKQVRFFATMKNKPLENIVEGQKADKATGKKKSMPQQEDHNVSIFPSMSPTPAQKYKDEADVDQFLTDKGTTEQDYFPSLKWGETLDTLQKNYEVPRNDYSDFSFKTNKPSSLSTTSEVSVSTLPSNDPQNEEYDYFDDLTSESSFGSDILKQTDVSIGSNLQSSKLSGSLLSLYSDAGDFGDVPIQGAVQFKFHYEEAKKEFQIQVIQCRGLAVANIRKYTSDPYVKTYLLPDRSRPSKRKSSVKKATLNPHYNEILKYKIKKQELRNRTLNLSVWHNDTLGRNVFLGETEVEMSNWDWNDNMPNWYNLQSKPSNLPEGNINQGEICVALKYIPADLIDGNGPLNGEVHIWLKEATQLQPLKPGGVDSFVRCYILPDTSKNSRQKTRVVKKTLNPIYNHTMVYDGFKLDEIMEACAELSIWDHETFTNQFLGGVRLNLGTGSSYGRSVDWMDSNEEEAALWRDMISSPNQWVEAALPLRPTMSKRK
ncbi:hypothetical protein scyTo_0004010 [Scyliorhinus torazame]|uniref:Synaptotagmin-like protein 1 n=1 Tax=Scyliorhinus torazame TaxID=75743 RepID=A0A401NJ12_SCYTO|nr:hypothetical protein [Scyliorhinus torazame]